MEDHQVPMSHPGVADLLRKMSEFESHGFSFSGLIKLPEHGAALDVTLSTQKHIDSHIIIRKLHSYTA
jgi:hypothetical protein